MGKYNTGFVGPYFTLVAHRITVFGSDIHDSAQRKVHINIGSTLKQIHNEFQNRKRHSEVYITRKGK
jgi:hypothetical protein